MAKVENELQEIFDKRKALILKARPKEALALIPKALKKYSGNIMLEADLAILIGDMEEGVSAKQRIKNHQPASYKC